jgi:hypothetical protein
MPLEGQDNEGRGKTSRADIVLAIKRFIRSRSPGTFELLEGDCRRMFGRSCIDLFLYEPEKLREVLIRRYANDVYSIYFTVKYLFLRPLLIELDRLDVEEEHATLFIRDIDRFRDALRKLLEKK